MPKVINFSARLYNFVRAFSGDIFACAQFKKKKFQVPARLTAKEKY